MKSTYFIVTLLLLLFIYSCDPSCDRFDNCENGSFENCQCTCDEGWTGNVCDVEFNSIWLGAWVGTENCDGIERNVSFTITQFEGFTSGQFTDDSDSDFTFFAIFDTDVFMTSYNFNTDIQPTTTTRQGIIYDITGNILTQADGPGEKNNDNYIRINQ